MAEDKRRHQALARVQDQAQKFNNSWKRGKSLEQLSEKITPILPPNTHAQEFGMLKIPQ